MANLRIVSDNAVSSATSVFAVPNQKSAPTVTLTGPVEVVTDDPTAGNLIDTSWWALGVVTASLPAFDWGEVGGVAGENVFVSKETALGIYDTVWRAQEAGGSGVSNEPSGGFIHTLQGIDKTKTYRFAIPVYQEVSTSGAVHFGTNSACEINTATPYVNPYFVAQAVPVGAWHMLVGYVYPAGSTGRSSAGAGLYNLQTGERVASGLSFAWDNASGVSPLFRAFQYYATAGDTTYFGTPLLHVVDGTEPSLANYFNGASYATVGAATTWGALVTSAASLTGGCFAKFKFSRSGIGLFSSSDSVAGLSLGQTEALLWWTRPGYYFQCANDGNIYAYSDATHTGSLGAYSVDTEFLIEYVGTTVKHYVNGSVVRTSTTTAGREFEFTVGMGDAGSYCQLLGFSPSFIATGTALVSGNTMTKPSGAGDWDSKIYSTNGYDACSGVTFTAGPLASASAKSFMVGLSAAPLESSSWTTTDYAIHVLWNGEVNFYESGSVVETTASPTYAPTTKFGIFHADGRVRYTEDGVIVRDVAASSETPLYLDISLQDVGSTIKDLVFSPTPSVNLLLEQKSEPFTIDPLLDSTSLALELVTITNVQMVSFPFCSFTEDTTVQVKGYATLTSTTPLFDTGALITPVDAFDSDLSANTYGFGGGRGVTHWFTGGSVQRVVITLKDKVNGANAVKTGPVVLGSYWSPEINCEYGAEVGFVDMSRSERSDAGDLRTEVGPQHKTLTLDLNLMPTDDRNELWKVLRKNGSHKPVFVSLTPDDDDEAGEEMYQIYGKLSRTSPLRYQFLNQFNTRLDIEEL